MAVPPQFVEGAQHAIRTSAACSRALARQIPAHFGPRAALPGPRLDQSWRPFVARSITDRHYFGEQLFKRCEGDAGQHPAILAPRDVPVGDAATSIALDSNLAGAKAPLGKRVDRGSLTFGEDELTAVLGEARKVRVSDPPSRSRFTRGVQLGTSEPDI